MFLAAVDAFVTVAIGMALVTSAFSLLLFDVWLPAGTLARMRVLIPTDLPDSISARSKCAGPGVSTVGMNSKGWPRASPSHTNAVNGQSRLNKQKQFGKYFQRVSFLTRIYA